MQAYRRTLMRVAWFVLIAGTVTVLLVLLNR